MGQWSVYKERGLEAGLAADLLEAHCSTSRVPSQVIHLIPDTGRLVSISQMRKQRPRDLKGLTYHHGASERQIGSDQRLPHSKVVLLPDSLMPGPWRDNKGSSVKSCLLVSAITKQSHPSPPQVPTCVVGQEEASRGTCPQESIRAFPLEEQVLPTWEEELVRSLRHPSSPTLPFWGQPCPESWKPCPGALVGQDPAEKQPCSPHAWLGSSPAGCAILLWIGLGVWFGAKETRLDSFGWQLPSGILGGEGAQLWGQAAGPERGGLSWWREGRGLGSDGLGRLAPGPSWLAPALSSSPSLAIGRPPIVCLLSLSHLPLLTFARPSLPWYRLKEA